MELKIEALALSQFRSHLSAIGPFMDDPGVQEIMVNAPGEVWVERGGTMQRVEVGDITAVNIRTAVKALAGANRKDVTPVLDCRMPGYRIAAVLPPVGIHGPAICIRKHARSKRVLDDYRPAFHAGRFAAVKAANEAPDVSGGTPDDVMAYVRWLVKSRKNVAIAGATGSGKTTFLNALLAEIPADQRVVTIEDTAELQVAVPNVVSFESAPDHGVTIRDLVRLSLRFRPDRIVVGEVRGPESYDLLDAMNTGHSGGACTLHSDSAILALHRLESMVRMNPDAANLPLPSLREQIAGTFAAVIYCAHRGEVRGPEHIIEILGTSETGYRSKTIFDASQPAVSRCIPLPVKERLPA